MSNRDLRKDFLTIKIVLVAICIPLIVSFTTALPSVDESSPWNTNHVKIKPHGKISAVKIKTTPSTTFKPKLPQTNPKFAYREPQWVPGIDQMQIESAPDTRYYPLKRNNKGFDLTTLVAVSLVSAFLGALTFSVVDSGAGRRSFADALSLLNFIDAESVAKTLSSMADWSDKNTKDESSNLTDKWDNNNTNSSTTRPASFIRTSRSVKDDNAKTNAGVLRWFKAYKKDPSELRCIQKLICETLATSSCAARSINSEIGGTVMNLVKYFVGSAGNVSDLIKETVGNPSKCVELTPYDFCDEEIQPVPELHATPMPVFNLSSITPRLKNMD